MIAIYVCSFATRHTHTLGVGALALTAQQVACDGPDALHHHSSAVQSNPSINDLFQSFISWICAVGWRPASHNTARAN
jgi:hypothetical protein